MNLEYLAPDGDPEQPLIRLYRGSLEELERLREGVLSLSTGLADSLAVHALPGFQPRGSIQLTFRRSNARTEGLREVGVRCFELGLAPDVWEHIAEMITVLMEQERDQRRTAGRYSWQWLSDAYNGSPRILLSTDRDGKW